MGRRVAVSIWETRRVHVQGSLNRTLSASIKVLRAAHPGLIGHATARSCFPDSSISGPSGVARLVWSGSLMSSVLFLTLWKALSVLCGLLPEKVLFHRTPDRVGQWGKPLSISTRFHVFMQQPQFLKMVALAAFCLLPSLRSTPSPTTLEPLQVGPNCCEATVHGAHQWFHRLRADMA